MKRKVRIAAFFLLIAALGLTGLTGCGTPKMEFDSAQAAKEALNTASTIEIYSDLYSSSRKTKILADGKVAGYLKGDTVYIDDEEWFHIDYVTDGPINDMEGVSSSTTYGYYDAEDDCLGYGQEQYLDTEDGGRDTFLVFLDVDGTPLDYVSSKNGAVLYDKENTIVGTGHAGVDGVGFFNRLYTNVYRTVFETDKDADITVDFMDRMAMYKCLQEDVRLVYDEPVNTGVQIFENLAVLLVLLLSGGIAWDKIKKKK